MTDQTIPADLTPEEVEAAREWATSYLNGFYKPGHVDAAARALTALLPAPVPPTLADMPDKKRRECQWMQADVGGEETRPVIVNPCWVGALARVMWPDTRMGSVPWGNITPRPDLPPLGWPGDQKAEDVAPVKVGTVIESADDPRVADLPVGTVLRDIDGEEVTRLDGSADTWRGPGYVPIAGDGTEYGPWTVARLPRKPAPAPAHALPDGWRLADHDVYGRVIVTTQTPNSAGNVYFVFSDPSDQKGHYWHLCAPDRLKYLDADEEDGQ